MNYKKVMIIVNHYINIDYKNELNKIKDEVCNYEKWEIYRKIFTSLLFLNFYDNKQNIGDL